MTTALLDLAISNEQAGILHQRGIITYKHFKALVMLAVLTSNCVKVTPMGWQYTRRKTAYQILHNEGYKWNARNQKWVKRA